MQNHLARRRVWAAPPRARRAAKLPRPAAATDKPALLGGGPVPSAPFPSWPVIAENEERASMQVLRSGKWNRLDGDNARQFEETLPSTLRAKHCLATANRTIALIISLN